MVKKIKKLDFTRIDFIFKGILVGIFVGCVVTLFRICVESFSQWVIKFYHYSHHHLLYLVGILLFSIIIGIILGKLYKSDPNIKGSGIPQVEGQLIDKISVNWFSVLWKKFLGGILAIGSGLFLGREGPSIQLGAVVGQGINSFLKGSKTDEKILISSGASAGLAAAFNAPLAGILFVLEEIHHSFSPLIWTTSFVSALTADFISSYFFGLKPVLYMGKVASFPLSYYWLLPLLGVVAGTLGWIYQKILLLSSDLYQKISFIPTCYYGMIPLLLVIPIGYLSTNMLGGGSQIILEISKNNHILLYLLFLFVVRFVFSMVSYGSNLPGGIFLPVLTLGAIIGACIGNVAINHLAINPEFLRNFIIFSMAGYFAAISKAPLTAILLITEMVGNFSNLMSVGIVVLTSYITIDLLGGSPIYELLLERMIQDDSFNNVYKKKITIEIPVTVETYLDGNMIRDVQWPDGMLLTSIYRGESELLTLGDTIIHLGDILVILTDTTNSDKIRQFIQRRSKEFQQF